MIFSDSDKIKINNLITVLKHNNNLFIPLILDYQKSGFQPQWDAMVNAKQNLTQAFIAQCNPKPSDIFNLLRFFKDNNIQYKLEKNIDEDSGVLEQFYLFNKKDELFYLFKEAISISDDFKKIILNTFSFEQIISFEKKEPDFFDNIIPYAYAHENKTFSYFINKKSYPYQKDFFLFLSNIKNEESLQNEFNNLASLLLNDKLFLNMDTQKTLFSNFNSFFMFINDNHQFAISHNNILEKIFSLENNFYNIIKSQQFIDQFLVNFHSEKHAALIPFLKNAFIKMTPQQTSEILVNIFTIFQQNNIEPHFINDHLISSIPKPSIIYLCKSLLNSIKSDLDNHNLTKLGLILIKNKTSHYTIQHEKELISLFKSSLETFLMYRSTKSKTFPNDEEIKFLIELAFPDTESWLHKFFVSTYLSNKFPEILLCNFLQENTLVVYQNIQYIQNNFPNMYDSLISHKNSILKKSIQAQSLYENFLLKRELINHSDNSSTPRKRL